MNRMIFVINNALYSLILIVFLISFGNLLEWSFINAAVGIVLFSTLTFLMLKRTKKFPRGTIADKKYNLVLLLALTFMTLIVLRNKYDLEIVMNFYREMGSGTAYNQVFLASNLLYFNIILLALTIYNLLDFMPNKRKEIK